MNIKRGKAGVRSEFDPDEVCRSETLKEYATDNEGIASMYTTLSTLNSLDEFAEQHFGVELHQMDRDQLVQAISEVCRFNIRSIVSIISVLKTYTKWCKMKGYLPHQYDEYKEYKKHPVFTIDVEDIDFSVSFKKFLLKDPRDVAEFLDICCDRNDGNPLIPVSILCWSGVQSRDVYTVKDSDVDTLNGTIQYAGETFDVPKELKQWLRDYHDTDCVVKQLRAQVTFEREPSDYFIKWYSSKPARAWRPITTDVASNAFSRANPKYRDQYPNRTIYSTNVFMSGRLYVAGRYLLEHGDLDAPMMNKIFQEKKPMTPLMAKRTLHWVREYNKFVSQSNA